MARIEKQAGIEKRLDEVKADMTSEIRRRTRRSRPWLTCSLVMLVALLGACVWVLWTLAATGLWKIPVFTAVAYDVPAPTRDVTPGVPAETVVDEAFSTTLTRRLYEGGGELTNRSIEITLSEASLTASLRSFLEESGLDWIDITHTQLVVDPEVGVELFVPFVNSELETAATLMFDLSSSGGNLVVTPKDVYIGSAKVPSFLIATFFKPFLEAELGQLNAAMVGYATISTIQLLPRELVITGELAVEVEAL